MTYPRQPRTFKQGDVTVTITFNADPVRRRQIGRLIDEAVARAGVVMPESDARFNVEAGIRAYTDAMTKTPVAEKVTKTHLVEEIAVQTGLSKNQAGEAFDAVMGAVLESLQAGKSVGLPGLGTLSVKATAARTGVKPGTSEKIQIPAGKKVAFKVASTLKGSL